MKCKLIASIHMVYQMILDYKPECIMKAFNNILKAKQMLNDRRRRWMVIIFKCMECNNCIGIQRMSHTMKLWERMIEAILRQPILHKINLDSDQTNQLQNRYLH